MLLLALLEVNEDSNAKKLFFIFYKLFEKGFLKYLKLSWIRAATALGRTAL